MECYLKPVDSKKEFCGVVIKEEVCFELIEEQSCIDGIKEESGIINDTKEEKACFDLTDAQSFTSDIVKEENILVNHIKKEDFEHIDLNNDNDFIKEEEEIDYVWSEDAAKKTDPLALPEIKFGDEFLNSKEAETVVSASLSESSNRKDSESLDFEIHDSRGKQYNERPHRCMVCGDFFSTPGHLKQHIMRLHTGIIRYKCNICDYASSQLGLFKTHIEKHKNEEKIHIGEGQFKSNVCEYAIHTSGNLKRHMKSHSGERSHKCNVCEHIYSSSSNLKRHMKVHTREQPYICIVCGGVFSQLDNFKTHMKKHTEENPYKYNFCEYSSKLYLFKMHGLNMQKSYYTNVCEHASLKQTTSQDPLKEV